MFLSYTHAVFLAAVLFCCAHGMLISYTICAPQKNDLRIFYFFAGLHQSIEQCGCIYRSSLSPNSVLKSIPPGEKVQDPHNPCIQYVCAVCAHACTIRMHVLPNSNVDFYATDSILLQGNILRAIDESGTCKKPACESPIPRKGKCCLSCGQYNYFMCKCMP